MSGTNHSIEVTHLTQPRMILVRPQMGENIGASARAMWNFALDQMYLVDPRDGWPNPAATAMASGAARVLDGVVVRDDLSQATTDLHHVFATTARSRDLTKEVLSPKEAMKRARLAIGQGQKVGILFGPERAGLENEDIAGADALISVPVNPAYGSLNLAQCVLLLSYEWQLSSMEHDPSVMEWASANPASKVDREYLQTKLEARLDELGFFWPKDKAESMKTTLRNMFSRMPLSDADVRMFHGIFRALSQGKAFPNARDGSKEES